MTDNQTERVPEEIPAEKVEDLSFDRILQRLRTVVGQLENGNLSLEDSLRVYEEGVGLARRGHELLDSAEKRVELLVRVGRGGATTEPLDAGDDESLFDDDEAL